MTPLSNCLFGDQLPECPEPNRPPYPNALLVDPEPELGGEDVEEDPSLGAEFESPEEGEAGDAGAGVSTVGAGVV
jgi:hypothetical protein